MVLHEGEEGRLLALGLGVEHPREAELRVEAAQEAVEGRGVRLVRRVSRGRRVDTDWRMTRRRLTRGQCWHPRRVRVGV